MLRPKNYNLSKMKTTLSPRIRKYNEEDYPTMTKLTATSIKKEVERFSPRARNVPTLNLLHNQL